MRLGLRLFGVLVAVLVVAITAVAPTAAARTGDQLRGETVACADADCFIQQAHDCSSSDWVNTLELDLTPIAPIIQSTTTAFHLQPADGGICALALSYPANKVRFTDEYVKQALAQGMSQADLDAAQAHLAEQGEHVTKVHFTCTFAPDDLVAMLTRWQAGSSSSDDLGPPNCALQTD